jgi:hypothetical protein
MFESGWYQTIYNKIWSLIIVKSNHFEKNNNETLNIN